MDAVYRLLLYIHILSAILSIGPFFILIPVTLKLRTALPETRRAYLDVFRAAVFSAKHAGHVLIVSGILLVITGSWSWKTPWIVVTILIMLGSLFFLARAFSPAIRKFAGPESDPALLSRKLFRALWIYIVLLLIMLWFMVMKPALWPI